MSKARARERKKKRLARAHETGVNSTRPPIADQKNTGNFNTHLNKGGKNRGGKNIPNAATSNRGSARSG